MSSNAANTLLEEARSCRERAQGVRILMRRIEDESVLRGLCSYLDDLERRAVEMEEYAAKLGGSEP